MEYIFNYDSFITERFGYSSGLGNGKMAKENLKTEYGAKLSKFLDNYYWQKSTSPVQETVRGFIYDILKREIDEDMNHSDMEEWDEKSFDDCLIRVINAVEDSEHIVASNTEDASEDEDREWEIRDLERDLKDAVKARKDLDAEQDLAAGQKQAQGGEWTDADGNEWGGYMNDADKKIEDIEAQLKKLQASGFDKKFLKEIKVTTKKEINVAIKQINQI